MLRDSIAMLFTNSMRVVLAEIDGSFKGLMKHRWLRTDKVRTVSISQERAAGMSFPEMQYALLRAAEAREGDVRGQVESHFPIV